MRKRSREIQSFIFSHYFSDGVRITLGVLLPSLFFSYLGQLAIGFTMSLGALCVSIADNPGPVIHKRNGMLACTFFIFLTAMLTGLLNQHPVWIGLEIIFLCFFYSMFSVYGNRATNIGTAALLVMILSIDQQRTATGNWEHAFYILGGGVWYFLLSLSVSQIRPYRLAQQALGECIKEVAMYVRLKARFYDVQTDLDDNYKQLITQQVKVHTEQDEVRELLFKSRMIVKDSTQSGRLLILVFVDILDLFEQTMATYYDYEAIRKTYGETKSLDEFKKIIEKIADELDNLSYCIIRNDFTPGHQFQPDLEALKSAIDEVEKDHGINNLLLKKILINVRNMADRTQKIYSYFNPKTLALQKIRSESDLPKFVSRQEFDIKLLKENLNFNSTIFRHSFRMALVCFAGYSLSKFFPVGYHSYWILLTILVILKPGFSLSKQRTYNRLIGTLVGGIAGALILIFIKDQTARFILLLLFMVGAYSFQRLNYIVSVLFMTPYVLILFSFLGANNLNIAKERIVDTLIGSLIAFIASYFVLPSWEYHQLKNYTRGVLIANYNYLVKVADNLTGKPWDVTAYKLARKDVYVSSANIGSAFQRMLSEPKNKQRNVKDLYKFVVLNHILSSYTATLISTLQHNENRIFNTEHIKLIRKSLYALSEMIHELNEPHFPPFKASELKIPEGNKNIEPEQNHDTDLLTEQLKFINRLTGDIQKLSGKLNV